MGRILVLVDCQNDFITGSLRNEDAINAVPRIVNKIKSEPWDVIILTHDTHYENYLETREGKKLPVVHCINGTDGWQINSDILNAVNNLKKDGTYVTHINKNTFGSDKLINRIIYCANNKLGDLKEIVFCGFCTDICVVSNVLLTKAFFYEDADIVVDASCCAGVTPETHTAALTTMKMCQIDVINE